MRNEYLMPKIIYKKLNQIISSLNQTKKLITLSQRIIDIDHIFKFKNIV